MAATLGVGVSDLVAGSNRGRATDDAANRPCRSELLCAKAHYPTKAAVARPNGVRSANFFKRLSYAR